MKMQQDRGIALVLSLFLMSAMSVLAASLMFLSQTETYASMNYRMMSQSRYGGEAAVQKAADFLLDSAQYTIPSFASATDPLANFNTALSPVRCAGGGCTVVGAPVVLSAVDGVDSNYPAPSVQTAFDAAAKGVLTAGNANVEYSAYATLVSMQTFESYGGGPAVVQTWEITGVGELTGARSATVEVVATVETPKVPANGYAAFSTDPSCGSMYFHGNVTINSYDSRQGPPSGPGNSTLDSGGDVGTNGNLQIEGSVEVQGNLYTPRSGVGTCAEGAVTSLSVNGNAEVTGSTIPLPSALTYPPPTFSSIPPTNTVTIDSGAALAAACVNLGLTPGVQPIGNCTVSGNTIRIDGNGVDITLPSIVINGGYTLQIDGSSSPPQTVNINSLSGDGDFEVNANLTGPLNEAVVLKVAGKNPDNTDMAVPFDLSQMSWKQNSPNHNYDASALQIVYGGPATIAMEGGNSQSAVSIYAPNADFELQGTQDLFGSVLARTIENHGNANIHYDRRLGRDFYVAGQPMVGTFSWKRF
jgi:Tfp pilus assembly protein PilX